ncbi:hypothetical protein [Olivibacter sp. XZL3]|uniref:hypothetical protein n=1 Tax=Olivibacter sp. XZL3 TaxID=1735116 RepID=UPI001066CA4A|nr:hypothetical protein [Olivibacter sp. XZL3]
MKWFVRFFLSLCLLFVSRYHQVHANVPQHGTPHTLVKVSALKEAASIDAAHMARLVFKPAPIHSVNIAERERPADNEEEDESVSSRKYVEISNYFTDFFYALKSAYLFLQIKHSAAFCAHFSYSLSRSYLLFRVIRI